MAASADDAHAADGRDGDAVEAASARHPTTTDASSASSQSDESDGSDDSGGEEATEEDEPSDGSSDDVTEESSEEYDAPSIAEQQEEANSDEHEIEHVISGDEDDKADEGNVGDAVVDIKASRWAFLASYLKLWLRNSRYNACEHDTPPGSASFDYFFTCVSHTDSDIERTLERQRHATELVAYMLYLDPDAWWFLRKPKYSVFQTFNVRLYDRTKLVPNLVLRPGHLAGRTGEDSLDGVERLHTMMCGDGEALRADDLRKCAAAKTKILQELDTAHRLRRCKVPVLLTFEPKEPSSVEDLVAYLGAVVGLTKGMQQRSRNPDSQHPFVVEGVHLTLYQLYLNSVHQELRRLVSCGFPMLIRVRPLVRHRRDTLVCHESGLGYAALAENPASVLASNSDDAAFHQLDLKCGSSCELWSALAFAPHIEKLDVSMYREHDRAADQMHVKWLSYALRHGQLNSLKLGTFEPWDDDMAAFRAVGESSDPTRLLAASLPAECGEGCQVVTLKPDAVVHASNGQAKSLAELGVEVDWRLPVVDIVAGADRIDFVVLGHAICSASLSSVVSIDAVEPSRCEQSLTSLDITSWYQKQPGCHVYRGTLQSITAPFSLGGQRKRQR